MDKSISIDRIAYILTRSHVALVFQPKLLAILLKRHSYDRCFVRHQVTPTPARTRAACVSLSLSTMSISSGGHPPNQNHTRRRKNHRIPLSGHPAPSPACRLSTKRPAAPISAASLSDPAYMATPTKVSSMPRKKMRKSRKTLKTGQLAES